APTAWLLRSNARWAFSAAENLRLADHIGLPATSFTGSRRWSTRGPASEAEDEASVVALDAICVPAACFCATADGPLSQPTSARAAAPPSAQASAIFSPAMAKLRPKVELEQRKNTTSRACRVRMLLAPALAIGPGALGVGREEHVQHHVAHVAAHDRLRRNALGLVVEGAQRIAVRVR